MQRFVYVCFFGFLASVIVACAPVVEDSAQNARVNKADIEDWLQSAKTFFIDFNENSDFTDFANHLNTLVTASNSESDLAVKLNEKLSFSLRYDLITLLETAKAVNYLPAKIDILEKQILLFWAHQVGFSGDIFLSTSDQYKIESMPKYKNYIQSLSELAKRYPALQKGRTEIYEADNQRKLLAFSRIYKQTRVFVAVNLSFETHEMPLPFGFMASTKVVMWQSDNIKPREFVTRSAIAILPYTTVIIVVGG